MASGKNEPLLQDVRRFLSGLAEELPLIFAAPGAAGLSRGGRAGKRLPFRGQDLPLRIVEDPSARRCELIHDESGLTLRRGPKRLPPQAVLRDWYAGRAREIFAERAAHWAPRLGVRYERITIRDQRTVWGSCTRGGRLSFNWRVVMAPPEVLDYLVVHELSHLLEMNHSKRFWEHVASQCPTWRDHRRWLRDHSRRLKSAVRRDS